MFSLSVQPMMLSHLLLGKAKDPMEWVLAINEEMNARIKYEIYDLVPRPEDVKPVRCNGSTGQNEGGWKYWKNLKTL